MGRPAQSDDTRRPPRGAEEESHRLQAAALWRRWRERRRRVEPANGRTPSEAPLPPEALRHYRHFAWVVHEQRIAVMILGSLLAGSLFVWSLAWRLRDKPPVVVRAGPSLKEAAEAYYGSSEFSYDQMAFFLHGCLPLLHATGTPGTPCCPWPRAWWPRISTARRSGGWTRRARRSSPTG